MANMIGTLSTDYCRHGIYVGGIGIDHMCGRCEDEGYTVTAPTVSLHKTYSYPSVKAPRTRISYVHPGRKRTHDGYPVVPVAGSFGVTGRTYASGSMLALQATGTLAGTYAPVTVHRVHIGPDGTVTLTDGVDFQAWADAVAHVRDNAYLD